jgi:hypothetical protein
MTLENEELEVQSTPADLGAVIAADPAPAPSTPVEPVKELSLKEEIQANLKKVQERPRDEHGRYLPAAAAAPKTEEPQGGTPAPATPAAPPTAAQQQPQAPQAPTSWSAEAKADFAKLPKYVQDAVAKREAEVHKGFTQLDEDRNLGKQMKDVISPYMPIIQAEGGHPVAAVKDLLNSAYVLRQGSAEQKESLVIHLCKKYGISLDRVIAPSPGSQVPPLHQPQPGLTREEVSQIAREEQNTIRLQSQVDTFANDPANKFYQQVRAHMGSLLTNGLATSLKDAYEQACRAHPQVSSSLEADRIAKAEEQRQAALRQKTNAAKHAGGSVSGGPGASPTPGKSGPERSLRDEIAHNLGIVTSGRI